MFENNLNQALIEDNNNNNFENNEQDEEEINSPFASNFFFIILMIAFLYYIIEEINYLIYSIPSTFINNNMISDNVFEKCIKYQSIANIYTSLSFIIICLLFTFPFFLNYIQNEELIQKLLFVYIYYFCYFLGPLITGFSLLGLLFYKNICYYCINNNPNQLEFDFSLFLNITIFFLIGINVCIGFNSVDSHNYMQESIKFKDGSNYIIGKLFWLIAQKRRRSNINEEQNEQNEQNINN